ncbi:MAG: response regulator transcription factor [Pseudomonadota bacterium]
MTNVLIIDDDRRHTDLLKAYLARFEIRAASAGDGVEGMRKLRDLEPELVILDVMLPGKDGFELCRMIRRDSSVPIIMLTARGEVTDRIVGLEIGADDYLGKPFEPRELVARIQTILRRTSDIMPAREEGDLVFGDLHIDTKARSVTLAGNVVPLTTMEYELLLFLASNPGRKLSRDEILGKLRGIDTEIFTRSVDIMVSRLRNKLGDTTKPPRFIQTVWGLGYCFVGHAQNADAAEPETDDEPAADA